MVGPSPERHEGSVTARRGPTITARRLILPILLFVLIGTPLVAYLWETANRLFAGHFDTVRLLLGGIALIALLAVLKILARVVERWEAARFD